MGKGGARAGAGRPKGTGKYGEDTITLRIPVSLEEEIRAFIKKHEQRERVANAAAQQKQQISDSLSQKQTTDHVVPAKWQETV